MSMRTHGCSGAFRTGTTVCGMDDPRSALLAERERNERLLADVERSMRDVSDARQDANSDDEHDPEGATLAWERGSLGAVRDGARERLRQVTPRSRGSTGAPTDGARSAASRSRRRASRPSRGRRRASPTRDASDSGEPVSAWRTARVCPRCGSGREAGGARPAPPVRQRCGSRREARGEPAPRLQTAHRASTACGADSQPRALPFPHARRHRRPTRRAAAGRARRRTAPPLPVVPRPPRVDPRPAARPPVLQGARRDRRRTRRRDRAHPRAAARTRVAGVCSSG